MESTFSNVGASSSIRYDWYQTDSKVVITILAKNLTQDSLTVNFSGESVSVSAKLPTTDSYSLHLNLLQPVIPEKCTYKLFPSKIEVNLVKKESTRWNALEKKELPKKVETKNWDAVAKELVDEKDADTVETLFSKIYSDGTDEQKKAMIKSFYESGGTVLSTNWNEVGKTKVEVKPPEGVEFKSWN